MSSPLGGWSHGEVVEQEGAINIFQDQHARRRTLVFQHPGLPVRNALAC